MGEALAAAADDADDAADEVDEAEELVEEVELSEAELGLIEVDEDAESVADGEALDGRNEAASFGFEERNPAVTSPTGHPDVHGLDLQQPMNGGDVAPQVYHRLPVEHCWSGNWPK